MNLKIHNDETTYLSELAITSSKYHLSKTNIIIQVN